MLVADEGEEQVRTNVLLESWHAARTVAGSVFRETPDGRGFAFGRLARF